MLNNEDVFDLMSEVDDIATCTAKIIANAITPVGAMAGLDKAGGRVASLTEAVIGMTAGLFAIAESIEKLADAIEGRKQ